MTTELAASRPQGYDWHAAATGCEPYRGGNWGKSIGRDANDEVLKGDHFNEQQAAFGLSAAAEFAAFDPSPGVDPRDSFRTGASPDRVIGPFPFTDAGIPVPLDQPRRSAAHADARPKNVWRSDFYLFVGDAVMKWFPIGSILFLGLSGLASAGSTPKDKGRPLEPGSAFEGTWELTSKWRDGVRQPIVKTTLVVKQGEWVEKAAGYTARWSVVRTAADPWSRIEREQDKRFGLGGMLITKRGAYRLDGDTLTLSFGDPNKPPPPNAFDTASGRIIETWKRVKPPTPSGPLN